MEWIRTVGESLDDRFDEAAADVLRTFMPGAANRAGNHESIYTPTLPTDSEEDTVTVQVYSQPEIGTLQYGQYNTIPASQYYYGHEEPTSFQVVFFQENEGKIVEESYGVVKINEAESSVIALEYPESNFTEEHPLGQNVQENPISSTTPTRSSRLVLRGGTLRSTEKIAPQLYTATAEISSRHSQTDGQNVNFYPK